jgi:phosphate transport system substrate-binding protein
VIQLLGAVLVLAGCSGCGTEKKGDSDEKAKLRGAGSSFVKPIMERWVAEYTKAKGGEINYQATGSTNGIKSMTEKSVDFGATDAFLADAALEKARTAKGGGDVIHIPLVMGGIVPAYNVEGIDKKINFTGQALADIYLGKITKWSELKTIYGNEGLPLPNKEIAVVARSDGSGSTNIFTDYLSKVSAEFKKDIGRGTSVKWPVGSAENGTSGVAGFIKKTANSLGYVELTYALQNKIQYGAVANKAKKFVVANLETVGEAAKHALKENLPEDFRFSITDAPGENSYPLAGTTWAVVYVKQPPATGRALIDFFTWVIHDGQSFAKGLDYAPLPEDLVPNVDVKIKTIQLEK